MKGQVQAQQIHSLYISNIEAMAIGTLQNLFTLGYKQCPKHWSRVSERVINWYCYLIQHDSFVCLYIAATLLIGTIQGKMK